MNTLLSTLGGEDVYKVLAATGGSFTASAHTNQVMIMTTSKAASFLASEHAVRCGMLSRAAVFLVDNGNRTFLERGSTSTAVGLEAGRGGAINALLMAAPTPDELTGPGSALHAALENVHAIFCYNNPKSDGTMHTLPASRDAVRRYEQFNGWVAQRPLLDSLAASPAERDLISSTIARLDGFPWALAGSLSLLESFGGEFVPRGSSKCSVGKSAYASWAVHLGASPRSVRRSLHPRPPTVSPRPRSPPHRRRHLRGRRHGRAQREAPVRARPR